MRKKILIVLFALAVIIPSACNTEKIDDQKPEIDFTVYGAFPVNCDTLWFGESFTFKVLFKDNTELGSFSLDIHHNFDHHSHSTEVTACEMGPDKQPENPFVLINDYEILKGLKEYETDVQISIPSGNSEGEFDEGDYHLFISLTDREGWSVQKGLSIKMLRKQTVNSSGL